MNYSKYYTPFNFYERGFLNTREMYERIKLTTTGFSAVLFGFLALS